MLTALVATLLLSAPDAGLPTPADNLLVLARAWEQVRLFHPALYEQELDWDQAWLKAAPKAEAAKTPEALHAAVAEMLASLKDPMTRVRPSGGVGPVEGKPGPLLEFKGAVPVVNVWSLAFERASESTAAMKTLEDALKGQPRVVFDLRGTAEMWVSVDDLRLPELGPSKDVLPPARRRLVHHGYASAGISTMYSTVFEETLPRPVRKNAPTPRRYAFVVEPDDTLPVIALAMQRAGEAFIVSTGPTDDRLAVSSKDVELGGGMKATVRIQSMVPPRGFAVDLVVPPGRAPIDSAVALINGKQAVKPPPLLPARALHNVVDPAYAQTPYPSRELRQLAGVRVWMLARRFWAYPHLTTEDYDAVLSTFLPLLAAAKDELAYALTLAEMTTHLPDGHTGVGSKALQERLGAVGVPFEVRIIEQQHLVWRALPEAEKAGVQRGDVVLEIDGQSVAAREAFLSKYVTASHPEALRARLAWQVLAGAEGSSAKLKLKKADGSLKVVEVERRGELLEALYARAPGPHYKVLEGNIGYLDLVSLEMSEVETALKALAGTRALIVDDRGYPEGAAFKLGPLLDVKRPRGVAQFFEPLVAASAETENQTLGYLQTLGPPQTPVYTQPTVTLIDDQAMSHAEHSGLLLEAYAGTTFVGSPTAGANGDVTSAMLPGGIRFFFTGHDVRHADGRQLQRIGLVPDVPVRPTIAGLRAGKDEVLDAAVAHLKKKLAR